MSDVKQSLQACGNARRILARLQLWTMAQPLPPNNLNN